MAVAILMSDKPDGLGAAFAYVLIGLTLAYTAAGSSYAQTPPQNQPEMSSHDEPATFQSRVNLVMVPVVVRDRQGRTVTGLKKEDFRLYDKGKPQAIARFSVESPVTVRGARQPDDGKPAAFQEALPAEAVPDHFIGYLFDDIHLSFGDLAHVREAAERHINTELKPTDRAAIFTTSGVGVVDFTDDLAKIHAALGRLQPRPVASSKAQECPDISYFQANEIIQRNDGTALQTAISEVQNCFFGTTSKQAEMIARASAQRVLGGGDQETHVSLLVLKDVVRRIALTPGQRTLVLASPGFLTPSQFQSDITDILDRAIRANVVINSLDARGLYVLGGDASQPTLSIMALAGKDSLARQSAMAEEDILSEVAAGTGGTFFHNSNDLGVGFHRLAASPESYYLLGFQPQNLKLDGSFHALRVTLAQNNDLTLQVRRGYYAPKHLDDPAETAKREVEEALFSREELRDIPVELRTQFFKGATGSATVAVLAHLDLKHIKFRKSDGRNIDSVTVVAGIFDRNGNYVTGIQKRLDFHLREETLASRLDSGITVRSSFTVKPGIYMVRLVVRDIEGETMAATNGAIDIP